MPMRPRAAFADLRSLASGATTRRGVAIAAIALVERMLTPVIALTLVQRGMRDKVLVTLLFGTVFTARSFFQRDFDNPQMLLLTERGIFTGSATGHQEINSRIDLAAHQLAESRFIEGRIGPKWSN